MRTFLTAAVVGAMFGCAQRAATPGRIADTSAPPKAAFEVFPAEQVAGVKNPHDFRGKALCQRCHTPDLRLTKAPNTLCLECHGFRHGNHPVDVVQKTPAPGLPLLASGKLACHTCHDPHQSKAVLRTGFDNLCKSCHKGH